jgi:hypothetical protein
MIAQPGKMTLHKVFCCVSLLMLFSTACSSGAVELVSNGNERRIIEGNEGAESDDTLYYLDINKPSIQQAIDPKIKGHERYKFVQIEVAEVTNPKKHLLTFEVRYQLKSNVTYLGSFSLYPSDNPGKFIVATQGKLRDEGAIILSLVTPDKIDSRDTIRVAVKKLKLLKG